MKNWFVCCILAVCLITTSCSDKSPKTAKVDGIVSVDGKPLTLGRIMMASELGRQTVGQVVDGKITNVTTFSEGDGAVVGENRVAIRPTVDEDLMMKEPVAAAQQVKSVGIPRKYYSLSTTDLSIEIKDGQMNTLNIDIETE